VDAAEKSSLNTDDRGKPDLNASKEIEPEQLPSVKPINENLPKEPASNIFPPVQNINQTYSAN
jgi:hypothetical protein